MLIQSNETVISDSTALEIGNLSSKPLVSILVSNYNYGRFLDEAIQSILSQSYETFEIIICDDGSTDKSEQIYQKYSSDHRIHVIRQERHGQGHAITQAFNVSHGDIICFLDADDRFLPAKLEIVVNEFKMHPKAGVCTHLLQRVTKVGKKRGRPYPKFLDSGWLAPAALQNGGRVKFAPTSGLSIRRDCAVQVFPIPDEFTRAADAYIVGMSCFICEFIAIPQSLSEYRIHGANLSGGRKTTYKSTVERFRTIHLLYYEQQILLKERFSQEIADRLVLADCEQYLITWIWHYIFSNRKQSFFHGLGLADVSNRLPRTLKNRIRQVLMHMPSPLSTFLARLWFNCKYYYWHRSRDN